MQTLSVLQLLKLLSSANSPSSQGASQGSPQGSSQGNSQEDSRPASPPAPSENAASTPPMPEFSENDSSSAKALEDFFARHEAALRRSRHPEKK